MDSDPAKPVQLSFDDDAVTDPEPERPRARVAHGHSRFLGWLIDAGVLTACIGGCLALAVRDIAYPLDFLRKTAALWLVLTLLFAFSFSFMFGLFGQTPGMAVTGHRLRSLYGGPPTVTETAIRAVLSLVSAGLGLFGFALALFDSRGQTLHDKLCRCLVLTQPGERR